MAKGDALRRATLLTWDAKSKSFGSMDFDDERKRRTIAVDPRKPVFASSPRANLVGHTYVGLTIDQNE
ncbi:hypothetical protein PQ465_09225 [Sphingobacterium oryzagri]|uniref:Uncharacterized protein n=1 Tax=Sphingobacterium oryzagri TaxID=3025669 RepID=A0ABY7WPR7_9SPHI|nr:hypothetical protein [Sphingobacterium sp. KACC 22765]WDF70539.1 hypothetical protein PQ465_09225 [Sphingobacterium sp. KACC 22765]